MESKELTSANIENQIKDIQNQIASLREKEYDLREKQKNLNRLESEAYFQKILAVKDVILPLLEHDRTSCSDENPINGMFHEGFVRCSKCSLIKMIQGELSPRSFKIQLKIGIDSFDDLVPFEF